VSCFTFFCEKLNNVCYLGETFVGGGCRSDFESFFDYANSHNDAANANNQWYVSLSGVPSSSSDSTDDDALSDGAVAGIVIGVLAGVAIIGAAGYYFFRNSKADGTKQSLL
jgi:hypothetical protein